MNKEKIERVIEYLESYDIENHEDADVHNDAIKICKESLEREKNEPLTLEQLEDMVNEPVFIKTSNEYLTMIISEIYKVDDDYRIIGFTIRGKEQTWYSFHEFYKYKKESE